MSTTTKTATVLRLEGVAIALAAGAVYQISAGSWLLFALLFLVPDLFMLGYLRNPRVGALVYNLGHTYIAPFILLVGWLMVSTPAVLWVTCIWTAHIGFDRALGYGLKDTSGFKNTHLQRI